MNVNKKLDRLRQWGKEKMGGDVKTATPEDIKALETEMNLRQDGLEKMHSSMGTYVKSLSKRVDAEGRDKSTVMSYLGSSMARHGEDFDESAKFGQCLSSFGLAHERIARTQESYAAQATSSWLDALERSLAQMRDYQNARKKLDSRRLAYDASLAKIQKAKKEDYRAEEELRLQKAKFEESTEDVQRRMEDIIESEQDNMADLRTFLEAELSYHDRCRDILLRLQKDWPAGHDAPNPSVRGSRSRENTFSHFPSSSYILDPENGNEPSILNRPSPPFRNTSRVSSANSSPHREAMPALSRTTTSELYPSRAQTPLSALSTQDIPQLMSTRSRQNSRTKHSENLFQYDDEATSSSPEQHSFWEGYSTTRSSSPATTASYATSGGASTSESRKESCSTLDSVRSGAFGSNNFSSGPTGAVLTSVTGTVKKAPPPPPPPSRATKPRPPPPPPPLKRSALSTSAVPYAA